MWIARLHWPLSMPLVYSKWNEYFVKDLDGDMIAGKFAIIVRPSDLPGEALCAG